jgi:hypothetical protein
MGMPPSRTTRTPKNRLLAVLLIAPFMAQADATIAGAIAIAGFGTAYLSLASGGSATHAFAIVTAGFAAIAGLAALLAHGATRRPALR